MHCDPYIFRVDVFKLNVWAYGYYDNPGSFKGFGTANAKNLKS
jgi:hypothetical protein